MRDYILFYDKDGTPIKDTLEWAKKFEDFNYRRVAYKKLWWGGYVSTMWTGNNMSFMPEMPPIIFESMVFAPWGKYGVTDVDQVRYSTIEAAEEGHKHLVKKWFIPFYLLWEPIDDFIWDLKFKWSNRKK